jgi:hypothetical protein
MRFIIKSLSSFSGFLLLLATTVVLGSSGAGAQEATAPVNYLRALDDYPHLQSLDPMAEKKVRDYLIPLGAIEKIRGVWSPRESERHSGILRRFNWRVVDGYRSEELEAELAGLLDKDPRAELIFSCEARACGSSVQWANRIFNERLLYGTEESQRYRVYAVTVGETQYRMLIYASARSSDRQYLHAELLELRDIDDELF